jgi:hypothetical protein
VRVNIRSIADWAEAQRHWPNVPTPSTI